MKTIMAVIAAFYLGALGERAWNKFDEPVKAPESNACFSELPTSNENHKIFKLKIPNIDPYGWVCFSSLDLYDRSAGMYCEAYKK